jgi:hypothetical protein
MNTITLPLVRAAGIAAALVTLSFAGPSGETPYQPEDPALRTMQLTGSVPLESISSIRIGSSAHAASSKLGHASLVLSDGTWLLYRNFYVDHSDAHGTLVVSFKDGRVSALSLVSPAVAVDLATHRGSTLEKFLVAVNR